jgi:hypothetical protein
MKTNPIYYMISLLAVMMFTSCNERDYCDFGDWDVSTVFHYDWNQARPDTMPARLNNELKGTIPSTFVSLPDWEIMKQVDGDFTLFCWNDAQNVTVKDELITVARNVDGSLKSVGELFTGKTSYSISNQNEKDLEKNSHHHWNDKPFHHGSSILLDTVTVEMKAQTRVICMVINLSGAGGDIASIMGQMGGIASHRSSGDASQGVTDGNVDMVFEKINDSTYVAKVRVIGADEQNKQIVSLTVNYTDGTSSEPDTDVTDAMNDFNDELGGDDKNIGIDVTVRKTEVGFNAIITDWRIIDGGTVDVPY